ncbi:MAG: CidA/LrgA family protein [Ruminococcaceae bacterium]|nr:CidA/LrgA family protein [Oscillospiraceae bacterium]
MKHLSQITIIAALSLAGELLSYLIPLPIPGSIYGLILMLILLILKVIRLPQVKAVSDWLLSLMPVMFVGPTVALIVTFDEYKSFLLPLLIVATVTTVIVMAVSGCTAQVLITRSERKEDRDAE